jgi:predicted PurR-regulated permease PerM
MTTGKAPGDEKHVAVLPGGGEAVGDGADGNHFSRSIDMAHWTSLLTVTATLLLLALVVAGVVWLATHVGHTLIIFSLGGLLAYALDPIVERARGSGGRRRSRALSALLVFGSILLVVVVAALLLSKTLVHQVHLLAVDHAVYEEQAHRKLADADAWLADHNGKLNLTALLSNPPANARTWGEAFATRVVTVLGEASKDVVEGFIVLLVCLYFLIYSEEMSERSKRSLPDRLRPYFSHWQDDVNRILGGFVRGQMVLALTIGAMAAVLCLILGIKLWLLLGMFVVLAALIPVVGPFIGAIPAVVAALLSPTALLNPIARVVILVAAFGVINEFGSKVLYPRLVGAALGLHEVLVLFILLAGFEVGGLPGVLFAAPLTALTLVTLAQLNRLWQGLPAASYSGGRSRGGRAHGAQATP